MTQSSDRQLEQLLQKTHGGLALRNIEILVHLSECVASDSAGACTAMCLQYPVTAKADAPEEAVDKLLRNLVSYLESCAAHEAFAPCWADRVYQVAFDYGDPLEIPAINARISQELKGHLRLDSDSDIVRVIRLRDMRRLQSVLSGRSIPDLFREVVGEPVGREVA